MSGRLDRVADVAVVGETESGDEAVQLAKKLEPCVILMDIKMPGLNGIDRRSGVLGRGRHIHGGGSTLPALSVAVTSQV